MNNCKKYILHLLILLTTFTNYAQQSSYTVSGKVIDKQTGEKLVGASIYTLDFKNGTVADETGFASLQLSEGKYVIGFSYVGYKTEYRELDIKSNINLIVELSNQIQLKEVQVLAKRIGSSVDRAQMSSLSFDIESIETIPTFLGDIDIVKTIELLPGVSSSSVSVGGLYVRGGGPDQNLMLYDGVPIYNANHLYGFFSVFNSNIINNVTLFKGGFPARFGGRLSSVIDINIKEGDYDKYKGSYSLGLISSKIYLEGPIQKGKTSFIYSIRGCYYDLFKTGSAKRNGLNDIGYYFYDLNIKFSHKFTAESKISLSLYDGRDFSKGDRDDYDYFTDSYLDEMVKYNIKEKNLINWGNRVAILSWNQLVTDNLHFNSSIAYSGYDFDVNYDSKRHNEETDTYSTHSFKYNSGIYDIIAKIDFNYILNDNNFIRFGTKYVQHVFKPGVNTISVQDGVHIQAPIENKFKNRSIYANEYTAYIEDELTILDNLKTNVGLHYSAFDVQNTIYSSIEPRLGVAYIINENFSLKASYSKMQQYVHLLTNSSLSMPTDLWLPATDRIKPTESSQLAVGGVYDSYWDINLSVEAYYKTMDNLMEYKDGASFFGSVSGWEDKIEIGEGEAYGVEILLNKTIGKSTGWIGYTISKTDRKFENINKGISFPAKYDRRHDISIVFNHKYSKTFDFGITWVYGTGNAVTLKNYKLAVQVPSKSGNGTFTSTYDSRNNYRVPDYHRLDIGMNFRKEKKRGIRTWNISVYNVYNQQNPFYLQLSNKLENGKYTQKLSQISLFSIMPSVSYIYTF